MIEKKIHWIWLSGDPLTPLVKKCIASWKKHCPDYEIILWNTKNFDVNGNIFCRQAYESKKWAFASDYIRLYVLYHHGGIYLDSDVEITKNLDSFMSLPSFVCFESDVGISAGLIGAQKRNEWIKKQLAYYDTATFIKQDGKFDYLVNPIILAKVTKKNYTDFKLNNQEQHFEHFSVYPRDYFSPIDIDSKKLKVTNNTHAIHHFVTIWDPNPPFIKKIKYLIRRLLGNKILTKYRKIKYKL